MKRKSSLTVAFLGLIAVLLGHGGPVVAQDAVLAIEGECPGQVRISWNNAHPDRLAELMFGLERGVFVIPNGFPCAGTFMGVYRSVRSIHRFRTRPQGAGSFTGRANADFCGGVLQIVVFFPFECQLSNVVDVPQ